MNESFIVDMRFHASDYIPIIDELTDGPTEPLLQMHGWDGSKKGRIYTLVTVACGWVGRRSFFASEHKK